VFGLATLAQLAVASPLAAQAAAAARPRIFLDCNAPNCNNQYFRTEIDWVNWVNDRAVADLHVIIGAVNAGGGGREYQLDFIGVNTALPYEEQQRYNQLGTDTGLETQDGLTLALGLGIAEWAYTHGYRRLVNIEAVDPELGGGGTQRLVSQEEVDDPWNLWVFRLNGNVNRNAEETSKNCSTADSTRPASRRRGRRARTRSRTIGGSIVSCRAASSATIRSTGAWVSSLPTPSPITGRWA
jgi:hypothetical protein